MQVIDGIIIGINIFISILSALFVFRGIFVVVGIFATRKFAPAKNQHKYAILIAARNEEKVIGNLIDSINEQDYPKELVTVFVVADNCTDNTCAVSREHGAVCYERFDNDHRTKGFALQYLVECIRRDYGIESFEAYMIFDADNLLKRDYISHMNDSFDAGEKIVTSYRNTKNFDSNWIAASYGIHWLRTVRTEHRARSVFHLATRIQGTGFLFASEIIRDGWNYTGFTEDRAFCADAVANGYKISYNDKAEFYDEQPTSWKIAMRQRIRWSKGHLQAFTETGGQLTKHIFVTGGAANSHVPEGTEISRSKRFFNNLRLRFMSYDMLSVVVPTSLIYFFKDILFYILNSILIVFSVHNFGMHLAPNFIRTVADFFDISVDINSRSFALVLLTIFTLTATVITCVGDMATAAYVFIAERKRIMHIKWYKKVWYCFTFPVFDLINRITTTIALFMKVEWKPIPHDVSVSISEVRDKHANK